MRLIHTRLPVLLCVSVLATLSPGCHRHGGAPPNVTVDEEILPQPVAAGLVTITVKLSDSAGNPIPDAAVTMEGDMAHPGMSPVFSDAKRLPDGRYQARLDFGMAGDWVVLTHIRLADGRTLERRMDVKGVRSN